MVKIFIWNNPYNVTYGGSFLFVVAETEEQAREIGENAPVIPYGDGQAERLIGAVPSRAPDRVIEAPYGECYEWSE